jgi:hypothetical protein
MATYLYSDGLNPWQTMKHKKHLHRRGEKIVFQTMNSTQKDNYVNGLKSITNRVNPRFFVDGNFVLGPVPCLSKPYFLQRSTYKEIK